MKTHSERVPNKNIKSFNGDPLFFAIVRTLQHTEKITKIVINTDSDLIADMATKTFSKVQINWRPTELQGDFVSMNNIIDFDLKSFPEQEHFLQTHTTNPLLRVETLTRAIEQYEEVLKQSYDSVFGVTRYLSRFYWQNAQAINHNPAELIRTQDLPPIFEENSNLYLFSKASFHAADNKRIGLKPYLFEINKLEAVDIDDESDFILAETLAKQFGSAK